MWKLREQARQDKKLKADLRVADAKVMAASAAAKASGNTQLSSRINKLWGMYNDVGMNQDMAPADKQRLKALYLAELERLGPGLSGTLQALMATAPSPPAEGGAGGGAMPDPGMFDKMLGGVKGALGGDAAPAGPRAALSDARGDQKKFASRQNAPAVKAQRLAEVMPILNRYAQVADLTTLSPEEKFQLQNAAELAAQLGTGEVQQRAQQIQAQLAQSAVTSRQALNPYAR